MEGARHHGYTGQRGYHPLLAIAAGPGDVLSSVREGRAAGRRPLCGRPWGVLMLGLQDNSRCGPTAASAHALVVVCRKMDVRTPASGS